MKEIFKPVIHKGIDYTGLYEVSNLGRVRNITKNKQVNLMDLNDRYHYVYLTTEIGSVAAVVHSLVYQAFKGKKGFFTVTHKDKNGFNNCIDNLVKKSRRDINSRDNGMPIGVNYNVKSMRYTAKIGFSNMVISIGAYGSPKKASKAYQIARKFIVGHKAPTKENLKEHVSKWRISLGMKPLLIRNNYGAKQDFKPKHITLESLNL